MDIFLKSEKYQKHGLIYMSDGKTLTKETITSLISIADNF